MKPVLAFVAGIVIASGVAYFATNHKSEQPPATVTASAPATPAPAAALPAQPSASSPEPVATPAPVSTPPAKAVVEQPRKKPAPMHTASNRIPATPAPAPVQAPPAPVQSAPIPTPAPAPVQEEPRQAPMPVVEAPKPPVRVPQTITIPAGTLITVRLEEALSTDRSFQGDQFRATLDAPIIIDHAVIAERGSRVLGKVAEIDKGGKVKGLAQLGIELTTLNTSDGQKVQVQTERFVRTADKDTKSDAAKVGGGAALGAIIGAIAGGGKGAAIGAGVGGAAGAGGVMMTRGKAAQLPVESKVSFRLREPITITERLR